MINFFLKKEKTQLVITSAKWFMQLDMVAHTCNPSPRKAKTGGFPRVEVRSWSTGATE